MIVLAVRKVLPHPHHRPSLMLSELSRLGYFYIYVLAIFFSFNLLKSLVSIKLQKQTNKTKQLCLNNLLQLKQCKKTL